MAKFGGAVPSKTLDRLASNDPELTAVDFSGNALFQMKSTEYCQQLGSALQTNTVVVDLNLANCNITDSDCALVAEALSSNASLTSLNLEVADSSPTLYVNGSVLQGNRIQSEGAKSLAKGLAHNTSVVELNLLNQPSSFGDACMDEWIRAFETNFTLQV